MKDGRLTDRRLLLAVAAGLVAACIMAACGEAASSQEAGSGSLAGTSWTLASYGDRGNPTPVQAGTTIDLAFDDAGKASGGAGCNRYFASYTAKQGHLTMGPAGSTMMACEQAVMQQETTYLQLLGAATTYELAGDRLQLTSPDGQVLNFDRAS